MSSSSSEASSSRGVHELAEDVHHLGLQTERNEGAGRCSIANLTDNLADILKCLEDPKDLAAASAVCRGWRDTVIELRCWQLLCLARRPELAQVAAFDATPSGLRPCMPASEAARESLIFRRLCHTLTTATSSKDHSLIADALIASSTDHEPVESIQQTLKKYSWSEVSMEASYWSSRGEVDRSVGEALVYRLFAPVCLIKEVQIQPFAAFFHEGHPVYAADRVQISLGAPRAGVSLEGGAHESRLARKDVDKNFVWSYTSPEYAMRQTDELQAFVLPEPVLCLGGILKVSLLGRKQLQTHDQQYYICMTHVRAMGCALPDWALRLRPASAPSLLLLPLAADGEGGACEASGCDAPPRLASDDEEEEEGRDGGLPRHHGLGPLPRRRLFTPAVLFGGLLRRRRLCQRELAPGWGYSHIAPLWRSPEEQVRPASMGEGEEILFAEPWRMEVLSDDENHGEGDGEEGGDGDEEVGGNGGGDREAEAWGNGGPNHPRGLGEDFDDLDGLLSDVEP